MRFITLLVAAGAALIFHLVVAAPAPDVTVPLLAGEPTKADLARARERLAQWESTAAERAPRVMRIIYWTPADREPLADFRPRLTRVMQHIQSFYGTQMASWGFPGRSIQLEVESDAMLKIPVAKGTLKSAECSESDSSDGQAIRRDCLRVLKEEGIEGDSETIVIFCNLADWDPEKRTMSHHSPYYAGGRSTGGTAWQVDSPLLDSDFLKVKDQHLQDKQYGHIPLGRYNSIFVGGVCHELGHALGLPHCRESAAARAARGTALMGSGNRTYGEELRGEGRGSFLTLPHALKLAAHPQFSGSVKAISQSLKAEYSGWRFEPTADGLRVDGVVRTNIPCHAVLAYGDPEGGSNYDAAIAVAVPHEDGTFSLLLPPTESKSRAAVLSFVAVGVNGAATAGVDSLSGFSLNCRIDAAGRYDMAQAVAGMELKELAATARDGKLSASVMEKLAPAAREALRRLALPDDARGKPAPDAAADHAKSLPLSDTAPANAETGYGGVHYDRTPERGPLIGPQGPVAHGLWAHANASFTYQLGGKWKTLTGECALLETGSGSVTGAILADGKTIWESKVIGAGMTAAFSLDLTGVQSLTLTTRGVKGIRSAHSAWLQPVLGR